MKLTCKQKLGLPLSQRAEISLYIHEGFQAQQSFSLTHTLNPICLDQDPNPLSTATQTADTNPLYLYINSKQPLWALPIYVVMYVLLVA